MSIGGPFLKDRGNGSKQNQIQGQVLTLSGTHFEGHFQHFCVLEGMVFHVFLQHGVKTAFSVFVGKI